MTKKQNTIVFIIIGTLVNVIIALALLLALSVIVLAIFREKGAVALPFVFIVSIALGIFIYQKLLGWAMRKWQLEDKLDPLFSSRYTKKPRD